MSTAIPESIPFDLVGESAETLTVELEYLSDRPAPALVRAHNRSSPGPGRPAHRLRWCPPTVGPGSNVAVLTMTPIPRPSWRGDSSRSRHRARLRTAAGRPERLRLLDRATAGAVNAEGEFRARNLRQSSDHRPDPERDRRPPFRSRCSRPGWCIVPDSVIEEPPGGTEPVPGPGRGRRSRWSVNAIGSVGRLRHDPPPTGSTGVDCRRPTSSSRSATLFGASPGSRGAPSWCTNPVPSPRTIDRHQRHELFDVTS